MTGTALVTGAAGQDGSYLLSRLLDEGWTVHALVRPSQAIAGHEVSRPPGGLPGRLHVHAGSVEDADLLSSLIADTKPDELYNLAGSSSVAGSFDEPGSSWRTNAEAVRTILEAIRRGSPATRMYQASTSEMFGWTPNAAVVHDERSPLAPQSPYAAAKASAHLLCDVYRSAFGLRIACGILFNHESRHRGRAFLTRKVVDHVAALRRLGPAERLGAAPLEVGRLMVRRDWGFAPEYVDGMIRIVRQVAVRASLTGVLEPDSGAAYRDYVLATGESHAVWEIIDRAFSLAGIPLEWDLADPDPVGHRARHAGTSAVAVRVDPRFLRPTDPLVIEASSERAARELGWSPSRDVDRFLIDMLEAAG